VWHRFGLHHRLHLPERLLHAVFDVHHEHHLHGAFELLHHLPELHRDLEHRHQVLLVGQGQLRLRLHLRPRLQHELSLLHRIVLQGVRQLGRRIGVPVRGDQRLRFGLHVLGRILHLVVDVYEQHRLLQRE